MNASPNSLSRHKGRLIVALILTAAALWFIIANRDNLSRESIMAYGEALPAVWLVVAFAILPMVGFPVSILLVLLGVRFGFAQGMAICAAGMAFHHIAGFFSVHGALRQRIHAKLRDWGYRLPEMGKGNPAWFTLLFAAVHGPPYTLKIYLLALTDIPFRIYFWVGVPVYVAFSAIAIAAGAAITTFDPTWLYVAITVFAVTALGAGYLKRRTKKPDGTEPSGS